MTKIKGNADIGYLVTCKMQNGNVIPAVTNSFSSATEIAYMMIDGEYAVEVKILKIPTGATFEFIV